MNASVHGVDPADDNLVAILRAYDFRPRPDDPHVWEPSPGRSNAALLSMETILRARTDYVVALQEMPEDPTRLPSSDQSAATTRPDPPAATSDGGPTGPTPESPTRPDPVPPRSDDITPLLDDSDLRPTTQQSRTDTRPVPQPPNALSAEPEPIPATPPRVPAGANGPPDDTRHPNPISPDPASNPGRTLDPSGSNRAPGRPEPKPYATPRQAHTQARKIDAAARAWQAHDDGRFPTSEDLRELREAVITAHRATWVAHGVHLGDPADNTDTPAVSPDQLRIVAAYIHTLATHIQTLGRALDAREQAPERAALRDLRDLTHRHQEAVYATIRHLDTDSPRTTGWAQAHTTPPTRATPATTGALTENTAVTGPAAVQPTNTQPPRQPATRTDPPTPPHPKTEYDHWHTITLPPARRRRHARNGNRDSIHTRNHKALIAAWRTANAPRVPPQTTSQHIRDLRDQGDRHTAVSRAAAKLAAAPQRRIEREALHELRVAAELHARHLYRRADALAPPRPRLRLPAVRFPLTARGPRQRPDPETLLIRVAEAEGNARQGIAGRDIRAKAHLHTTGPEHDRLVHDIRAEHAAAHQVMRDVRDRTWWHRADPGQIAAVWQRAVEWSAHHDVLAAGILREMRGRISQHHGVQLPTPPVNGINLNAALDRGHPAPAEGPTARWTYTVRDPLLHTRPLDQGEHAALARDTPHTVGRRVLADLAARGADPDALARAVVEIVPADRPDAKPVVVTAAQVREIGRDQAGRDRAERDLAQDAAALKSSLDNRWWEDARPVEVGWMWRAVQDWERGPARTDALAFLTDRVQATFGVTLDPDTPAVLVTERVREHAPAPLDTTGAPERAVAAHAAHLFDRANRIEARVAAGNIPTDDAPAQLQQARSHRLRARHLAGLASDPDEARHLLGAARPPAIDIDRFHQDIAAEYRRAWGRPLTDDESVQLRSILERGTANSGTNTTEDTAQPVATPPVPPQSDVPAPAKSDVPAKNSGPPESTTGEPERREQPPRASEPAPREPATREPAPETAKPRPATESIEPALQQRTSEPRAARPRPGRRTISMVRLALQTADDALAAAPSTRPRRPRVEDMTAPATRGLPETSVPWLNQ
ncbi:hypothetical protein ACIBSV_37015 [Embleya sp. NPDC050154]|uniref:hypothetical protein n=1 Tax=Embleya sp. NPDC050154 TaxID=3363988 RepID=UPI00379CD339